MKTIFLLLASLVVLGAADKFDCSKRYCKQMKSCKEAYHYLKKCGHEDFDKDKDGVPCENVCGGK